MCIFTKKEIDEILGIPEGLLPGERIAWIRDNIPEWHRPHCMSIDAIALTYAGTDKDCRISK